MANHSPTPWHYIKYGDLFVVYDGLGDSLCAAAQQTPDHPAAEQAANAVAISVAAEGLQRLADLAEACRRMDPKYCAEAGLVQIDDYAFDAILEEALALLEHVRDEGLVIDPLPKEL